MINKFLTKNIEERRSRDFRKICSAFKILGKYFFLEKGIIKRRVPKTNAAVKGTKKVFITFSMKRIVKYKAKNGELRMMENI